MKDAVTRVDRHVDLCVHASRISFFILVLVQTSDIEETIAIRRFKISTGA